jgi:hypothetical protein
MGDTMSTETQTTAVPADRRVKIERRAKPERRQKAQKVEADRRVSKNRREGQYERRRQIDPTTCERDYTDAEIEFMTAIDKYRRENCRPFPTWSEVLEVLMACGYRKVAEPAEPAAPVAEIPTGV